MGSVVRSSFASVLSFIGHLGDKLLLVWLDILEEKINVTIEKLDKAEKLGYYLFRGEGWSSLRIFMEVER